MPCNISQYLSLKYLVPAAITTAVILLIAVMILYGKKIISRLKKMLHPADILLQPEDLETMIEPSKRAISSIPVMTAAIMKMVEEKKVNAVHFINYLVAQSHNLGASDLHFAPKDEGMLISTRVEGTLYDIAKVPHRIHEQLLRRIKVMAELDVYKREVPQDGRITIPLKESIDIRVSVMPTIHGEKCVMRFFITPVHLLVLDNLGFNGVTLKTYGELYMKPQGTIFLTGPTGSGKTITAYATLSTIKERKGGKVNIVSIEDPVEFNLPFINQTQVNEKAGLTFDIGLKSLLRQDPNIILIGEIRNRETAEIAMQAGLTGHLILSSVHADSTAGVFARLINMGVEPFVLASASSGVLAQRLVRKLCPHCREELEATPPQLKKLRELGIELAEDERTFMVGGGCEKCLGMGYIGRTGIFELLVVDDEIQEAIIAKESAPAIYSMCLKKGMKPLIREALEKAREGVVSLEEILTAV